MVLPCCPDGTAETNNLYWPWYCESTGFWVQLVKEILQGGWAGWGGSGVAYGECLWLGLHTCLLWRLKSAPSNPRLPPPPLPCRRCNPHQPASDSAQAQHRPPPLRLAPTRPLQACCPPSSPPSSTPTPCPSSFTSWHRWVGGWVGAWAGGWAGEQWGRGACSTVDTAGVSPVFDSEGWRPCKPWAYGGWQPLPGCPPLPPTRPSHPTHLTHTHMHTRACRLSGGTCHWLTWTTASPCSSTASGECVGELVGG